MSVWSRINGVAGNIRSNITHFAAEVLEAVDEARASDDEDDTRTRQPVASSSAPRSVEGSAVVSRLSALKARLEADRSRSVDPELARQHDGLHQEQQEWSPAPQRPVTGMQAQGQDMGVRQSNAGTDSHQAAAAVSKSGHHPDSRKSQTVNVPLGNIGPEAEPAFEDVALSSPDKPVQSSINTSHLSPGNDTVHGNEMERLKRQIQRLKTELVNTTASQEEEQERTEKAHKGEIDTLAREISDLKEQNDIARRTACQPSPSQLEVKEQDPSFDNGVAHARIMELQVRIKELQAENARLSEDKKAKQAPDSIPFGTATEAAFWSANAEGDSDRMQQLQAELQALQSATELSKEAADAEVQRERKAHADTQQHFAESQAALQEAASREKAFAESAEHASEVLRGELQQLQAQQLQVQGALESEQSAHARTRQRLTQVEESLYSGSALQESQLSEERARYEQIRSELEIVRQQQAKSLSEQRRELQAEQQRCREAQEELSRVRQELAAAVQAGTEASDALIAERRAKEAERSLHTPAMLESLPLVVELRSQLQAEQAAKAQVQADAEVLQQRYESLAEDNGTLRAAAEELQQRSATLRDAEARASAMEREAASCRREADEELSAAAHLRTQIAKTSAALRKEHEEREELQRHLDSAMLRLEETAAQKSSEAEASLRVLQENLVSEQDRHRSTKAEAEGLRAELEQLQQALEDSASALTDRDAFWKEELLRAQSDMRSSQARVAELEHRSHAAEPRLLNGTTSSEAPETSAISSNGDAGGGHSVMENPLFGEERSPWKQPEKGSHSASELAHLKELLAAAEDERNRARQQLNRLKQATMAEQEDEEDKMRWRIEAEVRLALEAAQQAEAQRQAHSQRELANLRAELESSKAQAERLSNDVEAWNAAVAARDAEIQNLQAALGELAYSSEAAERLRAELRASAAKLRNAEEELAAVKRELGEGVAARQVLKAELEALRQEQQKQSDFAARLSEETVMLRRALAESMKRLKLAHSDADAMVDRRIVTKLLITYFERGRSDQSVLNLMASMLGFTEEEKRKVGLASKAGILRTVAGAPLALVKGLAKSGADAPGTPTGGDASLANEWVEFLIQQAEAADAVEANGRGSSAELQPSEAQTQL